MKEKNVLIITGVFPPEPVVSATITNDVAIELSKKYVVTVLCPKPTRPLGYKFDDVGHVLNMPYKRVELDSYVFPKSELLGRFRESISMGRHAVRYINEHYDEIDLIYNAPWQLFGCYMISRVAKKYKIPYITPVQDFYPESLLAKIPAWKWLQKMVVSILLPIDKATLSNARKVHTISDKMKIYLAKTRGIDERRFAVIQNWQDEEQFVNYLNTHKPEKSKDDPFTFMYLGNVSSMAGIDIVIDAFALAKIPDARLVIAGAGSEKESLQKLSMQYNDVDIQFWNAPKAKVPEIQDRADVMVLPLKKGFSLSSIPSKLPSYLFSAKPVIACVDFNSDTALSIISSQCGWVEEPENIEHLKVCMQKASATEKDILEKMGENGFNFAMTHFSRRSNLPKLCKVYEDILDAKELNM